ncbi:hypothetical protein [uncultured Roseobacter sp.]|uniref:hypothetical protein n=1 Tax=uncultured Roseobacter sp. TaxID=114847 RepID=UPI002637A463|nr:hypothetical protein [uncultured Roseobacter sp.]
MDKWVLSDYFNQILQYRQKQRSQTPTFAIRSGGTDLALKNTRAHAAAMNAT